MADENSPHNGVLPRVSDFFFNSRGNRKVSRIPLEWTRIYLDTIQRNAMFSFKIFQKPNWVNAELKFTLSGDSPSSDESGQSSENDQLKLSEMPIPEYIKEIASRGMLKFWKLIFSFWAWSSFLREYIYQPAELCTIWITRSATICKTVLL